MDDRVVKYYSGSMDKQERVDLLRESSTDKELFEEMVAGQTIRSLSGLHSFNRDEMAGRRSLSLFKRKQAKQNHRLRWWTGFRYAAIALVCIFGTWFLTRLHIRSGRDESKTVAMQEFFVPAGQRAQILLPDGSKVWLNARSKLTYPSVFGSERRVWITGEALFNVAKDSLLPFIVSTGKLDIRAVGTEFDVFNYPGTMMRVSLLEGAVLAYDPSNDKKKISMSPETQLVETGEGYTLSRLENNPALWTEGYYSFKELQLSEIINQLELYYDVQIIVEDRSILQQRYTGTFRQMDGPVEVLRLLQKVHPFSFRKEDNTNIIYLSSAR